MRRFSARKIAKVASLSGLVVAGLFTAVMGFAHTKAGRPLLVWMGHVKPGTCPLGYDVAHTPAQKEAARRAFAAVHAGPARAWSRPALGFVLDQTTRADVQAWARRHGVTCMRAKAGSDLDCADVPEALLPASQRGMGVRNLWLTFGPRDALVSIIAVRRGPSAEALSSTFTAVTRHLAGAAGPPAAREGDASAARLSAGPLHQASAEYRFHDYYALARATNMGDGYVLTEEYRALPN